MSDFLLISRVYDQTFHEDALNHAHRKNWHEKYAMANPKPDRKADYLATKSSTFLIGKLNMNAKPPVSLTLDCQLPKNYNEYAASKLMPKSDKST